MTNLEKIYWQRREDHIQKKLKKIPDCDLLSHILFQVEQIKKTVLEYNKINSY